MLAEGDVLEFGLATGLAHPAANVIVRVPPVELRHHDGRGGTGINGAIVGTLLTLHALLRALGSRALGLCLVSATVIHVVLSILLVIVMMAVIAVCVMRVLAFVVV